MFRSILRHLQANILHKIIYSCILNLYVYRLLSQPVLKNNAKYMSSSDFSLGEDGRPFPAITGTGKKGCVTPTAGRIRQHFADSSALQTGTITSFVKAMDQTGSAF